MTTIQGTGPQPPTNPPRPKKAYKGLALEGFIAHWYAN